ncbi:formate/nitrite transporter family protein [Streptomyces sp. NPDC002044]|uniref:formate/nitrite transporter family protein n=1 Tax=Streptomyces sp. NPDC002044 TaxID=3154662 RepID=UPI00332F3216
MGGESTEPRRGSSVPGGRRPNLRPVAAGRVFVAVGFEHRVANMALFSLAILDGPVGFSDLCRKLMFAVPENVVGGGSLVGAVYWFAGGFRRESGTYRSE